MLTHLCFVSTTEFDKTRHSDDNQRASETDQKRTTYLIGLKVISSQTDQIDQRENSSRIGTRISRMIVFSQRGQTTDSSLRGRTTDCCQPGQTTDCSRRGRTTDYCQLGQMIEFFPLDQVN